jgi:hypothetical protein
MLYVEFCTEETKEKQEVLGGARDKRQEIEEPCELETLTHGSEAEPGRRRLGSGQPGQLPGEWRATAACAGVGLKLSANEKNALIEFLKTL